ncbi:hypothetical protein DID75_01245 [Candidatus Marinamargulisbacteria bacterium SCGC AG-410-N11]|nr:hypothetical protein DID75_01245 [Candidatus Marinamargulisbacteria bacterium SCGC AG-410-N11]
MATINCVICVDGLAPYIYQRYKSHLPFLTSLEKKGIFIELKTNCPTHTMDSQISFLTGIEPNHYFIRHTLPPNLELRDAYPNHYSETNYLPYCDSDLYNFTAKQNHLVWNFDWWITQSHPNIDINFSFIAPSLSSEVSKYVSSISGFSQVDSGYNFSTRKRRPEHDLFNQKLALSLLSNSLHTKRSIFFTLYYGEYDQQAFQNGPSSKPAIHALKIIDKQLNELHSFIKNNYSNYNFTVVSDHGFQSIDHSIAINQWLCQNKLIITNSDNTIKFWKCAAYSTGGCTAIYINPRYKSEEQKIQKELESALSAFITLYPSAIDSYFINNKDYHCDIPSLFTYSFPHAYAVLFAQPPYSFSDKLNTPLIDNSLHKGAYGFRSTLNSMDACFFSRSSEPKPIGIDKLPKQMKLYRSAHLIKALMLSKSHQPSH